MGSYAQILSPHDKNIQSSIFENLEPTNFEDAFAEEKITYADHDNLTDPLKATSHGYYNDTLKAILFDEDMNRNFEGKIVYTAMHGVGADYIDQAFATAGFQPVIHVKEQRGTRYI